jgi:8-hydroxy-5-deazaflavin:NADPH oxidoreductase
LKESSMNYAIIGLGKIGTAIAQAFARQGIELAVAGRRPLDALAAQIGPSLVPARVEDAVRADIVILAVPFAAHADVGRAAQTWKGKVVIDATNAFGVTPEELGGLPSTAVVASALPGAKLVKAFNHLQAGTLARGPRTPQGGRRVVFISSDDAPGECLGGGPRRPARLRPGRAGEDQRGRLAHPGTGPHLGPADFPRLGQVRLIDPILL